MATLSLHPAATAHPPASRRLAGLAFALFIHALLILGWQMARTLPAPDGGEEQSVQWLRLPPPAAAPVAAPPSPSAVARPVAPGRGGRPAPAVPDAAPAPVSPAIEEAAPAAEAPAASSAAAIVENARSSAGAIARALRKGSRPLIVAPPDSPQIRMREGMEHAHAMAAPRLWETPKIEELVNNTGDGARRTRVITGRRTYCITERAPTTNVEMIEMHGKIRFTNCPEHETPAKPQAWRTARD